MNAGTPLKLRIKRENVDTKFDKVMSKILDERKARKVNIEKTNQNG